jgi:hypothetical protein
MNKDNVDAARRHIQTLIGFLQANPDNIYHLDPADVSSLRNSFRFLDKQDVQTLEGMIDGKPAAGEASAGTEVDQLRAENIALRSLVNSLAGQAVDILDTYKAHDSVLCCSGEGCGCRGATVHDQMRHYIEQDRLAAQKVGANPYEKPAEDDIETNRFSL